MNVASIYGRDLNIMVLTCPSQCGVLATLMWCLYLFKSLPKEFKMIIVNGKMSLSTPSASFLTPGDKMKNCRRSTSWTASLVYVHLN